MSQAVIVDRGVLAGEPIRAITWLKPAQEWDSGYAVFTQPPDATDDCELVCLVCLDCLLQDHPEIGKGLDIAHRCGEAIREGNNWA